MKSFCFEDKRKINGDDSVRNSSKKSSKDNFSTAEEEELKCKKQKCEKSEKILLNEHDNVKHHAMLQANQAHLKNSHLINGRNKSQFVNLNSLFADGKSLEQRKSQLEKLSLQYVLSKGKEKILNFNLISFSFFLVEGRRKLKSEK